MCKNETPTLRQVAIWIENNLDTESNQKLQELQKALWNYTLPPAKKKKLPSKILPSVIGRTLDGKPLYTDPYLEGIMNR